MAPPARASFVARCRKDARVLGQLCLLGLGHAQEPSSRGRVAFTTVVVLELLSTSPSCAEAELLLLLPHVFRLIAPHMPPHAQVAAPASPLPLPCISPYLLLDLGEEAGCDRVGRRGDLARVRAGDGHARPPVDAHAQGAPLVRGQGSGG